MTTKTFDAVVIGAGPGGYVAAIRLAQLGKKTALVEREELGGVCLNWGCIPSKALIAAANLVEEVKQAGARGILVEPPKVDVAKLREFKDGVVKKMTAGVGSLEKGNGVEVIRGTARFVSATAVEVEAGGEKTRVEAKAFIVATGARPIEIPGFKVDGKEVWGAREALDLPEIPRRLVCIGGGVIGMELGTVYAKLGSQVTFLEALPQVLTGIDPEATRLVTRSLGKRGAVFHLNAKAKGYEARGGELWVRAEVDGKPLEIACDRILVGVGFRPSVEGLGLEPLGVKLTARGFVEVDASYRTAVPSIYVVGDLSGPPLLAHKASKEGEIAAEAIAGKKSVRDWAALPAAVFTDPEVAVVGLSEEEARKQGLDRHHRQVQLRGAGPGGGDGPRRGVREGGGGPELEALARRDHLRPGGLGPDRRGGAGAGDGRLPGGRGPDHPRPPDPLRGLDGGLQGRAGRGHPRPQQAGEQARRSLSGTSSRAHAVGFRAWRAPDRGGTTGAPRSCVVVAPGDLDRCQARRPSGTKGRLDTQDPTNVPLWHS